jgi:hypothetical protein
VGLIDGANNHSHQHQRDIRPSHTLTLTTTAAVDLRSAAYHSTVRHIDSDHHKDDSGDVNMSFVRKTPAVFFNREHQALVTRMIFRRKKIDDPFVIYCRDTMLKLQRKKQHSQDINLSNK